MGHEFESPPALEALLTRLDEMAVVVGPAAAPRLGVVRERLARALGLRASGDVPGATAEIRRAMEEFAALADDLDPAEGALMRAAVQVFAGALGRGEAGEMERSVELMREKSGAKKVDPQR